MRKALFILLCFFVLVLFLIFNKKTLVFKSEFNAPAKTWSTFVSAIRDKNYDLVSKCFLPNTENHKELSNKENINKLSLAFQGMDFEIIREERVGNITALLVKARLKSAAGKKLAWVPFARFNRRYLIVDGYYGTKDFEIFETEHLIFHYEKRRFSKNIPQKESEGYFFLGNDKKFFNVLEKDYKQASNYLGVSLDKKIDYYIVTSKIIFQLLTKYYEENDLPAGVALPEKNMIVTLFSYNPHEIIHILDAKILNSPLLLNEILTNYVESKITGNYRHKISESISLLKSSNNYIPLTFVFKDLDVYGKEPIVGSELILFVDYLIKNYSFEKFKMICMEFDPLDYNKVFIKYTGKTLEELEEEFKKEIELLPLPLEERAPKS